jgi:hypothetical protein
VDVSSGIIFAVIGGALLATFAIVGAVWHNRRSSTLLDGWARANGLQILSQSKCWFFRGPFSWSTTDGQVVYRVVVRDGGGRTRTGYVRCGGRWSGMLSDNTEVRWND